MSPILMLCSLMLVLPRCSNGADTTILADYLQEGLFDPAGDSRMFVMQTFNYKAFHYSSSDSVLRAYVNGPDLGRLDASAIP